MAIHHHLASANLMPLERLFFELYGRALQGDALTQLYQSFGFTRREARAEATRALATARGLLLDRLATSDDECVDAAAGVYAKSVMDRLGAIRHP